MVIFVAYNNAKYEKNHIYTGPGVSFHGLMF